MLNAGYAGTTDDGAMLVVVVVGVTAVVNDEVGVGNEGGIEGLHGIWSLLNPIRQNSKIRLILKTIKRTKRPQLKKR